VSGLDNMQLVCSERKPRHPAIAAATNTTNIDAQSRADPAGDSG
jgi:hypothetical protein